MTLIHKNGAKQVLCAVTSVSEKFSTYSDGWLDRRHRNHEDDEDNRHGNAGRFEDAVLLLYVDPADDFRCQSRI